MMAIRAGGTAALLAVLLVGGSVAAAPRKKPAPAKSEPAAEAPGCRKLPAGKRVVKLTLKPETDVADLVAWISSITCKQFVLPGTIPAASRKVTITSPQLMTPEEAYELFLAALDSVGLTVRPSDKFYVIIETSKAKTSAVPTYTE
jgi:general secretion pathway protein D